MFLWAVGSDSVIDITMKRKRLFIYLFILLSAKNMEADRLCIVSFLFGVSYRVEVGTDHRWNTAHGPYDN